MTAKKVYIRAVCFVDAASCEPDYKSILSIMEARRMTPMMKRAVWCTEKVLEEAGVKCPDAILCGTGYGCLLSTEAFFTALHDPDGGKAPSPTAFMQSTHNTIASLLAIRLGCHSYNATYSHSAISFESALLDAFLRIQNGLGDNALVCAFEEMSPMFRVLPGEDGSETAVAMLLSSQADGALCELEDVEIFRTGSVVNIDCDRNDGNKIIDWKACCAEFGSNLSVCARAVAQAALDRSSCAILNDGPFRSNSVIKLKSICGN